jgi:hypothetical protein
VTSTRRLWASRIGAAFGVWLVICVAANIFGNHPRPGLVGLAVAASAATLWLFLDASAQLESPRWAFQGDDRIRQPGEDPRLGLLSRVVGSHLDGREVTDVLQRRIAELADHRLVAHHGVSVRADPARAATLMGPELAAFLSRNAPYARLTLDQIDVLISRLEAL